LGAPPPNPYINTPKGRQTAHNLIKLLRHPNLRIREAAYQELSTIVPDVPGGSEDVNAWDDWIAALDHALPAHSSAWPVDSGGVPVESALAEIVNIRLTTPWQPKDSLARDPKRVASAETLVALLRHPDERVRSAAFKVLYDIQDDHKPASFAEWESWLA